MSHWSDVSRVPLSKFRIRIGNDEIALPMGISLCGRDPESRIAIADTLVSRRHARILCEDDAAVIEDLGSRNGTRVNGALIAGPHVLRAGDRVGIGVYELVVAVAARPSPELTDVPTGLLTICPRCRSGYSALDATCPQCGAVRPVSLLPPPQPQQRSDETTRGRWSLGMLLELQGKAIMTNRATDAEKLMREIAYIVSGHITEGKPLAREELQALSEAARWLAKAQGSRAWVEWLAGVKQDLTAPP
jgi:hypothetical protein